MEDTLIKSGSASLACGTVGSGPLVIFLHAGVADQRSWEPVQAVLAADYRCCAYDRRGYGETTATAEPFAHTADLLAVHEALGAEPAILVGNSQGGRIAIDFALAYPERVRGLALVAPAVSGMEWPDNHPQATTRLLAAIEAADEAGDVARVNALEAHLWLDGPESQEGRVSGAARELFLEMNGRALNADDVGEEEEPPSAVERLGELTMPVHVVLGGLDFAPLIERGRAIETQVQVGSSTLFEDAAHLPQMENPGGFTADLALFLERVVSVAG